jgi:hypothetical protein
MFSAMETRATDPIIHCAPRDEFVPLLTGPPHREQQTLVLQDQMPEQGHRFELFMNMVKGEHHSYTLLRTRTGGNRACIVTAGLVGRSKTDERGRDWIELFDENHPDTFNVITCEGLYVITRKFEEEELCNYLRRFYGSDTMTVSYGRIVKDLRASGSIHSH